MNKKTRDYQVSRVYYSESIALPFFDDTMTFEEAEKESFRILQSKFVSKLISKYSYITPPTKDYYVFAGDRRYKHAQSNNDFVCYPKGTRNQCTICHEIAHSLTIRSSEKPFYPYHGKQFCGVYLQLVRVFMGDDFYITLKESFDEWGVEYLNLNI